ncbi:MAG: PAS domain-containing protein [Rhodospirillaceae bacterium]|nr:PAS domain-containing protein [Rhodospirillaceae bacterium]
MTGGPGSISGSPPDGAAERFDLDVSPLRSAKVRAGYAYWRGLCRDRLPSRAMIDPTAIPALLPHVVIHGVRRDPLDFVYRLIGTEVRRHMAQDRTGQWMSAIEGQKPPSRIWDNLAGIVASGRPVMNRTPYEGPLRDIVTMETVQLPLAADGATVDMILVFVDFLGAAASR